MKRNRNLVQAAMGIASLIKDNPQEEGKHTFTSFSMPKSIAIDLVRLSQRGCIQASVIFNHRYALECWIEDNSGKS